MLAIEHAESSVKFLFFRVDFAQVIVEILIKNDKKLGVKNCFFLPIKDVGGQTEYNGKRRLLTIKRAEDSANFLFLELILDEQGR